MPAPKRGRLVVPDRIRIRGCWWRVVRDFAPMRDSPYRGLTLPCWKVIFLAPGQSPGMLEDTLLHEILHACLPGKEEPRSRIVTPGVEERVVQALTPPLLRVLRQLRFKKAPGRRLPTR